MGGRSKIVIDENCSFLVVEPTRKEQTVIGKACSYVPIGASYIKRHSPFGGKINLANHKAKGGTRIPIGCLRKVSKALRTHGNRVFVTDLRETPDRVEIQVADWVKPRKHQGPSVDAVTRPGVFYGSGVIKAPIRSGKTITGALLIARMCVRTLFVVPSAHLRRQAIADLGSALTCPVGKLGSGSPVEVATVQQLDRMKPAERKLLKGVYGLLIIDEAHHMTGTKWAKTVRSLAPRYMIGLSATLFEWRDSEIAKGVIRVIATCGSVAIDVSISDMIDAGYLVAPEIEIVRIESPQRWRASWSAKMLNECIYQNPTRNAAILEIVQREAKRGSKILINTRRVEHLESLEKMLRKGGVKAMSTQGLTKVTEREAAISKLMSGEIDAIVSTVMGEGLDVPQIDVVINAAGGSSPISVMQGMRNLTAAPGKTKARVYDFFDATNAYLAAHSRSRLEIYRSESRFVVRDCDSTEPICTQQCPF